MVISQTFLFFNRTSCLEKNATVFLFSPWLLLPQNGQIFFSEEHGNMALKRKADPDMRRKTWEDRTRESDIPSLQTGWYQSIFFSCRMGRVLTSQHPVAGSVWSCAPITAHFQHKVTKAWAFVQRSFYLLFPHRYLTIMRRIMPISSL